MIALAPHAENLHDPPPPRHLHRCEWPLHSSHALVKASSGLGGSFHFSETFAYSCVFYSVHLEYPSLHEFLTRCCLFFKVHCMCYDDIYFIYLFIYLLIYVFIPVPFLSDLYDRFFHVLFL